MFDNMDISVVCVSDIFDVFEEVFQIKGGLEDSHKTAANESKIIAAKGILKTKNTTV